MRGVWARILQAKGIVAGAMTAMIVLAIVVILITSRGGEQSRQTDQRAAQATSQATSAVMSVATATDTPAATATPRPTPTATRPPAPTPTATATPFSGKITRVVNSVPWLTGSVSVSCPAGTTMVGGGEDNGYGTSGYIGVQSSYPSDSNTWHVIGPTSTVSYTLSAVADCLQSPTPVTTTIITLTSPTSSYSSGGGPVQVYDVRCPSGVVTGGGYDVNIGADIVDSHPDGSNGWVTSSMRGGLTAYAICASAPLKERVVNQTVTYPLYAGSGAVPVVLTTLSCPSGYAPLSGGFGEPQSSDTQIGWGSDELDASGQQWDVTGADKSGVPNYNIGDVYALCALMS